MTYVKGMTSVRAINFCVQLIKRCRNVKSISIDDNSRKKHYNDLRSDGGVNVPTLVAVEVLVGLSERSGLLPFICFVPFVPSCEKERCSCANLCSFFCRQKNTTKMRFYQQSFFVPDFFCLYTHQFMFSLLHFFFRAHHFLYLDKPLLMSSNFLFIAQSLFSFVYSFLQSFLQMIAQFKIRLLDSTNCQSSTPCRFEEWMFQQPNHCWQILFQSFWR